jgi:hypothetical protein
MEKEKVEKLLFVLKELDKTAEQQGLRALVMPCEKVI